MQVCEPTSRKSTTDPDVAIRPPQSPKTRTGQRVGSASYARYVGRVGALAVALGVGAAIASTPLMALADTTGSSDSASDTTTQTNSSNTEPSTAPSASGGSAPAGGSPTGSG
jgi:hypothetical protein